MGHAPRDLHQRDLVVVARQTIEIRAMNAGETFEPVERIGGLKYFGIKLDAGMRGINARAAAIGLLGVPRVRRTVRAKEEARVIARGGLDQCRRPSPWASRCW